MDGLWRSAPEGKTGGETARTTKRFPGLVWPARACSRDRVLHIHGTVQHVLRTSVTRRTDIMTRPVTAQREGFGLPNSLIAGPIRQLRVPGRSRILLSLTWEAHHCTAGGRWNVAILAGTWSIACWTVHGAWASLGVHRFALALRLCLAGWLAGWLYLCD